MSKSNVFIINLSINGSPPEPVGKAPSMENAIKQIRNVLEVSQEVYRNGYGDDPATDVYSVYDEKNAITRWTSKNK